MRTCEDVTVLLSQRAERKLLLMERVELRLHVLMCSGCRRFGRQLNIIKRIAGGYAPGRDGRKP